MSPQAVKDKVKDKDKTQDGDLEADAPPLDEQENPVIFDGDIEKLNDEAPPIGDQTGAKTDLNALGGEGLHKTSVTFGIAYSDYETDGAGHGPEDFASEEEVERADDDAKEAKEAMEANAPDEDDDEDEPQTKSATKPRSRAKK